MAKQVAYTLEMHFACKLFHKEQRQRREASAYNDEMRISYALDRSHRNINLEQTQFIPSKCRIQNENLLLQNLNYGGPKKHPVQTKRVLDGNTGTVVFPKPRLLHTRDFKIETNKFQDISELLSKF